jgi:hypothetical protein
MTDVETATVRPAKTARTSKKTAKTAKKTKPADGAGERRPTPRSPMTRKEAADLAATAPKPADERSGNYIRTLLVIPSEDDPNECKYSTREIVGFTRHHFRSSACTSSDVGWNANFLRRKHGIAPLARRRG